MREFKITFRPRALWSHASHLVRGYRPVGRRSRCAHSIYIMWRRRMIVCLRLGVVPVAPLLLGRAERGRSWRGLWKWWRGDRETRPAEFVAAALTASRAVAGIRARMVWGGIARRAILNPLLGRSLLCDLLRTETRLDARVLHEVRKLVPTVCTSNYKRTVFMQNVKKC